MVFYRDENVRNCIYAFQKAKSVDNAQNETSFEEILTQSRLARKCEYFEFFLNFKLENIVVLEDFHTKVHRKD